MPNATETIPDSAIVSIRAPDAPQPFPWTEELDDEMRQLFSEGYTAAQVAVELGVTKNMVIGRCFRRGIELNPDNRSILPASQVAEIRNSSESAYVIAARLGISHSTVCAVRRGRTHLKEPWQPAKPTRNPFPPPGRCLFPYGHPNDDDFEFCGSRNVPGRPYCAQHSAVVYRPAGEVEVV